MARRTYDGKTVVVTGGARGLGQALCRRFGRAGARLGALDLLAEELAATRDALRAEGIVIETAVCDLSDEAATTAACGELRKRLGAAEVLVANAGMTHIRPFGPGESAAVRKVLEVNVLGAVHPVAALLDDLKAARGQIVVVSSVAGFSPLVGRTGYCASKHALHGFFDTLRAELRDDGVDVLLACPSSIATGIRETQSDRRAVGAEVSPATVADQIYSAARRRRRQVVIGRVGRAAFWLHRLAPRWYESLMRRQVEGGG